MNTYHISVYTVKSGRLDFYIKGNTDVHAIGNLCHDWEVDCLTLWEKHGNIEAIVVHGF